MEESPKAEKNPEFLSTLERGLRVLKAFDADAPEMQLSEVAVKTGLSPAVARRCLNTLVELGYMGRSGRKFLLKPKTLEFGWAFLNSMNIEEIVLPFLQTIRDETGDSSSLAILSGSDILYLAHVSTNRKIRLGASVGTRFPAYATSLGRVLLAYQPDSVIDDYIATTAFQKFTEHTINTKTDLLKRLQQVRMRGYDSAQDELDYGIVSVSVPISDPNRNIVAAINCSTSTTRIKQEELIQTRLPLLQNAALEIEASLKNWPALVHALNG